MSFTSQIPETCVIIFNDLHVTLSSTFHTSHASERYSDMGNRNRKSISKIQIIYSRWIDRDENLFARHDVLHF